MEDLKQWYRDMFRLGTITDKQLQKAYEAATLTRSSLMRWIYDNYELTETELASLKEAAKELGYE